MLGSESLVQCSVSIVTHRALPHKKKKRKEDKQKQNVASRLLQAKEAFTFAMHKLFYQMVSERDGGNWWCVAKGMPKIVWTKQ